jgi:hypothetical protein
MGTNERRKATANFRTVCYKSPTTLSKRFTQRGLRRTFNDPRTHRARRCARHTEHQRSPHRAHAASLLDGELGRAAAGHRQGHRADQGAREASGGGVGCQRRLRWCSGGVRWWSLSLFVSRKGLFYRAGEGFRNRRYQRAVKHARRCFSRRFREPGPDGTRRAPTRSKRAMGNCWATDHHRRRPYG